MKAGDENETLMVSRVELSIPDNPIRGCGGLEYLVVGLCTLPFWQQRRLDINNFRTNLIFAVFEKVALEVSQLLHVNIIEHSSFLHMKAYCNTNAMFITL